MQRALQRVLIINAIARAECLQMCPRIIKKNIPKSINKRLSEISIDETSFNQSAPLYQKAVDDSGYHHHLTFTPSFTQSLNSTRTNRCRNIIWYNPPFSKNVATNVGRTFLKILDEEFPENHVFHKIFNRNTVKSATVACPTSSRKSRQINPTENDCTTNFESMQLLKTS